MNNIKRMFFLFFCIISVNGLYAQFYTVKKKSPVIRLYSSDETAGVEVFTKPTTNSVATSGKDTLLSAKHLTALDGFKSKHLFSSPLESDTLLVTSPYGYRLDPFTGKRKFHAGTDFRTCSENVLAMMPGRVKDIGYKKSLGNFIEIEHGDFMVTYGHLYTVIGRKGDYLRAGQSVGISGSTGRSTGEHLHVSVQYKRKNINPYPFILYIMRHSGCIVDTEAK